MSPPQHTSKPEIVPELHVQTADGRVFRFTQSFHIGRDHDCALRLNDVHVSRKHVAVSFDNGEWRLRDLKSANGIFVKNRRVETATVEGSLAVTLGTNGPTLTFEVESQGQATKRCAFLLQTVEQGMEDSEVLARYEERNLRVATGEVRWTFSKAWRSCARTAPKVTLLVDMLGRHTRGDGNIAVQPFRRS